MADNLESNIILRTKAERPSGDGFKVVKKELGSIQSLLDVMTQREYIIKLRVDASELKKFGIDFGATRLGSTGAAQRSGRQVDVPSTGTGVLRARETVRASKKGPIVTQEEVRQQIQGLEQLTETVTAKAGVGVQKIQKEALDLVEKERIAREKKLAIEVAALKIQQEQNRLLRGAESKVRENLQSGRSEFLGLSSAERRSVRDQERSLRDQRRADEEKARTAAKSALDKDLRDQARIKERHEGYVRGVAIRSADQSANEIKTREQQRQIRQRLNQLNDQGFQPHAEHRQFNRRTGSFDEIVELRKVSGSVLRGYQVEVARANVSTGKFSQTLLQGAAASKAIGDSLQNAVAKVTLWASATGIVFGTIRAIQGAIGSIKELEEGTVLLARVGSRFSGGQGGFEERFAAAKQVTREIIDLTTAIGGVASEAQKAAAIFARAGQDEVEVVQSVRVALLAARIAELDVVEAAQLLSSSQLQFNLSAGETIDTLDLLNTLSNRFRVTTDDLLQSISRSGSIIAQNNGRLSELAAITAITSQRTSRSGSEIGNAIKTIASNLDRLETRQVLFERLGVSVAGVGGETKSYSHILLELSVAMDQLTASEKNALTVSIAGVRQRNILLNQLNGIVDAIRAENAALLDAEDFDGSAFTEFAESSTTFSAAIQRLQANLVETASTFGGPFAQTAKDAANALSLILKLLNTGNGIPAQMLGWVAVIGAVAAALRYLSVTHGAFVTSLTAGTLATTAQVAANTRLFGSLLSTASATQTATAATTAQSTAQAASIGTAAALSLAYVAVAAGILLLLRSAAHYAEKQAVLEARIKSEIDLSERKIRSYERQATAYRNAATQVGVLIQQAERLRAEELSTGKNNQASIKNIESRAQQIAAGVGVQLTQEEIKDAVQSQAQFEQKINDIYQERAVQLRDQLDSLQKQKSTLDAQAASAKDAAEGLRIQRRLGASTSPGFDERAAKLTERERELADKASRAFPLTTGLGENTPGFGGSVTKEIDNQVTSLNKFKTELIDIQEKIDAINQSLQENGDNLKRNQEQQRAVNEATSQLRILSRESERQSELAPFDRQQREIAGQDKGVILANEIAGAEERRAGILKQLDVLEKNGVANLEEQKSALDSLKRETELLLKLENDRAALSAERFQKGFGGRIKEVQDFEGSAFQIAAQKARGLAGGSQALNTFADTEARQQAVLNTINASATELELTNDQNEKIVLRQRIQEGLVELKELEFQKALDLLRAEKDIALERKKSADEALRALGALSEEDKLRVLAQAQFFARNPDAKVSLPAQFLGDSDSNSTLSRFFGSKLEGVEGRSPLAAIFGAAGIGETAEQAKAAKDAADARRGRSDEDIIGDARDATANLAVDAAGLTGDDATAAGAMAGMFPFRSQPTSRGEAPDISLDVRNSNFDLTPMLDALKDAFSVTMEEQYTKAIKYFQNIIDETRARTSRIPARAGAGQ